MAKIIAEIGWNHMGDMDLAEKMIISASESGADICKFQTWSEKNLIAGVWDDDGRREIYQKAELTKEKHVFLKNICKNNNVDFMSSIFNINDIDFLANLSSKMIKIPSHEVYNLDLIKSAVDSFDLIFISTGAAKWEEILSIINNVNMEKVVLMHCVSTYPCPLEKINFPRLNKLKTFTENIGYSGHYSGIEDAITSIALGSKFVEKHFTVDQDLPGRDNKFAILPEDLKKISNFRNNYEQMNIDLGLDLQDCEMDTYNNYRGRWSKND
jgi:N,N'-diacetyllegionaminate synthase